MTVTPPIERPNESAGYLGYYTRVHLPEEFDLVDIDGTSPVVWFFRKSKTKVLRIIEEKPTGQRLHPSQDRLLRDLAKRGLQPYVIYEADRLVEPRFPVRVVRLGAHFSDDRLTWFQRDEFDKWLLDGVALPVVTEPAWTWEWLVKLAELPYAPPADLPDGVDWNEVDKALTQLAKALRPISATGDGE